MLRQSGKACAAALAALQRSAPASQPAQRTLAWFACSNATPYGSRSERQSFAGLGMFTGGATVIAAAFLCDTAFADAKQQQMPSAKNPLILYQYEICPWCCKVKAVLDFHKLPYKAVEVNPVWKQQLAFSEYKKVPVLITPDGEQLNDSSVIIDHIMQAYVPKAAEKKGWFGRSNASTSSTPEEQQWREFVDRKLVQLITANIYSSWDQASQSMRYITETGNWGYWERQLGYLMGTVSMYFVGRNMPSKYKIEGDLRENLYAAVDSFIDAVGKRDFLGGKQPSLADLAVFGVIRAVQNTDTFYDVLEHTKIKPWWFRMVEAVGESSRTEDEVIAE